MGNGAGAGSRDDERESEGHDVGDDPPAPVRLWPVLALDAVRSQILLSANEQERANLSGAKIGGEF